MSGPLSSKHIANPCAGSLLRAALVVWAFGALSACASAAVPERDERADAIVRQRVAALERGLPERLRKLAQQRAKQRSVEAILDAPERALPGVELRHIDALRLLYTQRDHRLVWVEHEGISWALREPGAQLLEGLELGVSKHGLWSDELHLGALRSSRLAGPQVKGERAFEGVRLSDLERAEITRRLREEGAQVGQVGAPDEALNALLADLISPGNTLAHLSPPVEEQAARLRAAAHQSSRVEVLLSDALAQYALRMRYENPAWHRDVAWPEELRDPADAPGGANTVEGASSKANLGGEALKKARRDYLLVQAMQTVFEEPNQVGVRLEHLAPPFETYQRLVRAFQRYSGYVEAGGWPEVPAAAKGLRRGAKNAWVPILKRRLRVEGYYQGDDSEVFTQELRKAVLAYQQTHQLYVTGRLSEITIRSLNVSALERRHQVQLTLQRWRESRIGADPHYVLVNLADFHASVWRDGQRTMYFGVVVGANRRDKKGGYPRETPRFSDTIEYIVFNPYWNVPKSIRRDELEPKQAKDPTYFEREGFEYFTSPNGHEVLRQKPGPANALGQVKFLFPNKYNVYLHDTPSKELFERPHRAFSHGCVRIEDPMNFAQYLLDLDGRWMEEKREEKLEEWMAKEGETWVNLRQDLPVHIEYYVVRVDDEGHANFLADLYRLDRPRLEEIAQRYRDLDASSTPDAAQAQQVESSE